MEFSRVVGDIDDALVKRAESKLTAMFLDLALRYTNTASGTHIGGDPFIYALMYPTKHICTNNIPTAATDGKVFYWNPKFVLKNSALGLRVIASHEGWHAIYLHPSRVGKRDFRLWNICVDYVVNWNCMESINSRQIHTDGATFFKQNLGEFKTVEEFVEMLKDPFSAMDSLKKEGFVVNEKKQVSLPDPLSEAPLTDEQKNAIEDALTGKVFYYADPDLPEDMRKPEILYDYFLKFLPKCPECNKLGMYKKPNNKKQKGNSKQKEDETDDQDQNKDQGDSGDDQDSDNGEDKNNQQGQGNDQCGTCGGDGDEYVDVFGFGGTVDTHMPTTPEEKELTKRIANAMETASRLAGKLPASIEEELGRLTAPKMSWKDVIRGRQRKAKQGNTRNDWTKFKIRPMFAGMMTPKKVSYASKWGCLLDCSGSMSDDDIIFGISQLQSLDDNDEGVIVPADADIYWDKATKIRKSNKEELSKVKVVGRGGTVFGSFFSDYKEHIGKCDFLVIITDGYLCDVDTMENPGVDVVWIITSHTTFKPPFGRSYHLRDDF